MTKITIAQVLIITAMIFTKETLTAQWTGTNPVMTTSDVGVGSTMLGGAPFFTLGAVSNPLGQVHISHIRPTTFNFMTPIPKPQLFLESDCETGSQFMSPMRSQYSLEVDCYGGNFKINSHDVNSGGTVTNLFSMNNGMAYFDLNNFNVKNHFFISNTQIVMNKQLVSNQNANFYQKVFIGSKTATFHPDAKLHVEGKVAAQHFVITKPTNWSDKVFQKGYNLWSLNEIEKFINKNKHLPDVPSEAEVMEKGYDANEMDAILLQKIEELTLLMIELKKENESLKKDINNLKKN